jgi:hypothetical protein
VTRLHKIYTRIVRNPKDIDFEELDKLLRQYGFKCRQPGKGSSHYIYHHPELLEALSIPKARPVKAVYVRQAIAAIEKLKERGEQ